MSEKIEGELAAIESGSTSAIVSGPPASAGRSLEADEAIVPLRLSAADMRLVLLHTLDPTELPKVFASGLRGMRTV